MKYILRYWILIVLTFVFCIFLKPALCLFILGTVVLFATGESLMFLRRIKRKGIECTGTILSFESDAEGYKTPVVEYISNKSDLIREQPAVYISTDLSKVKTYRDLINSPVSIIYDPDNPDKFILSSEQGQNQVLLIILCFLGLASVIASIISLLGYFEIK